MLKAINVAVEIFVIKTLSVLNLVVILVAHPLGARRERSRVLLARIGANLNC